MKSTETQIDTDAHLLMRSIIQRVATGPELSKEISREEAHLGTRAILEGKIDPVQAAIYLIALRMKRETHDEFKGVLDAIREVTLGVTADVDEVVDIADPYDGYNRCLPASPFLAPLLAACDIPAVCHGLDAVGPKYGATHRHILEEAGVNVNLDPQAAADRLSYKATGWSYVDQAQFCPALHDIVPLRTQMVKRTVLTTVEVLAKPIVGKLKTHFVTGYVHKPYPPIYAMLARHVGFDTALLIRGVEGGITPSLRQDGRYFSYHNRAEEEATDINPDMVGIKQHLRAVPLPENLARTGRDDDEIAVAIDSRDIAKAAAEEGMAAMNGKQGATYDSLVYSGALVLDHLGKAENMSAAADQVRAVLDSGEAAKRVQ